MTKSILLIGSNGQVGQELQQILPSYGNAISVARPTVELTEPETLRNIIKSKQPQIIINAAAYTAVDKAESEPELATAINATAPLILAEESQKLGAFLIHISTDYVFDGNGCRPYQETDATNPLSVYGKTKLTGEQAIRENCTHHLILRTAWVYGNFGKSNFVKTMLRLGAERPELRIVADQIGSPTWAKDIAAVIAEIIPHLNSDIAGTYHYTNSGVASWYDFGVAIFEEAQQLGFPLKVENIVPITTPEYPTPARRPPYSVLACGKISTLLGKYPPHWRQQLRQMLKDWG
ncbi:MAG: dTDP-4-dehydrorhamnose reductase [Nostoc sp. ZfuVER08]|jgi:dTDP-4-dehydrorhamnose reductase|uniref:dTDP-4-dehydrorhamnose reductase n=1 Tax=Nostoc punctiforme FACHB-252 TaxID=1357509 RepID=A0ABR8HDF3_NOSPU|nr:dTDP-4-dehydrorhamnose reductase [Nostoc punctiforme]MBD2613721.1 dTDP-4-dehydrorhamnose reductase [Nostoc punctiforme FACHB-252]MBL1198114.1 dTDP-4-dehydrorhamnose reductase [Nostoc sp. GBBB01]MDZ8012495.1 dTDP-4-dehydrorhamnose reductase [Nostoc sp. ZfuVER08]